MPAVAQQLVVQVRAGDEPGGADAADDLALRHARPGPDAGPERRQVQVAALVAAGVAQRDGVAAAGGVARRDDGRVGDRDDRRALRRPEVGAEVRPPDAEHRVQPAVREARRDARLELERRGEEEALQRQAGGVVVGGLPAGRLEAERAEQPSGVGEPRRDDVAVADARAVAQHLLEDDFDDVARLQVAVEVDVAAEQLGDPDRQADVLAGPLERGDERRVIAIDVAADGDQRRPRGGRSRPRW